MHLRALFGSMVAMLALGCEAKPGAVKTEPAAASACKKFGDSCEFSPGKLGTCVQKTECTADVGCLVCQSQH